MVSGDGYAEPEPVIREHNLSEARCTFYMGGYGMLAKIDHGAEVSIPLIKDRDGDWGLRLVSEDGKVFADVFCIDRSEAT